MSDQSSKEKFEEQLKSMRLLQIKVRRNPIDNASWKKLREDDAVLQQLFDDVYPSLEAYMEECFKPVNELASEWGLAERKPFETDFYKKFGHSFFDTVNSIRSHASDNMQTVQGQTRDISIKTKHDPRNIQPIDAGSVQSMLQRKFHEQTPDGNYDFTGKITDIGHGRVHIGGFGTGNVARFMKVTAVDVNGKSKNFVLQADDLEHCGLDKSPQRIKKIEVGDMISVDLRNAADYDMHNHLSDMRGLQKVQSLFLVAPAAFFNTSEKDTMVIDGRVEEYGKVVLHGDWPTREVTLSDAAGNKGTFTMPGNADFDRPTAKEGDRVVGVASRSGRLSVLRPF